MDVANVIVLAVVLVHGLYMLSIFSHPLSPFFSLIICNTVNQIADVMDADAPEGENQAAILMESSFDRAYITHILRQHGDRKLTCQKRTTPQDIQQ